MRHEQAPIGLYASKRLKTGVYYDFKVAINFDRLWRIKDHTMTTPTGQFGEELVLTRPCGCFKTGHRFTVDESRNQYGFVSAMPHQPKETHLVAYVFRPNELALYFEAIVNR